MNMQNILDNGTHLGNWAIDINEFGDLESNGGREFLVVFKNKYYLIRTNWQEEAFSGEEIFKRNFEEVDFINELITNYEKGE